MPNYKKIAKEAIKALEKIVTRHDKAAAEEEPGFSCGCKDCRDAELALGTAEEEGMP